MNKENNTLTNEKIVLKVYGEIPGIDFSKTPIERTISFIKNVNNYGQTVRKIRKTAGRNDLPFKYE